MSSVFQDGILRGKTAYITGGSSGICYGIAQRFAAQGARVAIQGRNQEKLDQAVASLRELGGEARGYAADVRHYDATEGALADARAALGEIDILVCGAAGNFPAPVLGMSANGFKAVVDIDLLGTFNACRAAHEHLRKPGASVIAISATHAFQPYAYQAHVCAAKAGIDMLRRLYSKCDRMHEMSVFWLRCAAVLYAVGLLDSIYTVLKKRSVLFQYALACFCVGAVVHLVSIVEQSVAMRHLAANNFFETASLCSFLIAVVYLFVYWRYQFVSLSIFLFPLVFTLALIGAMGTPVGGWSDPQIRSTWLLSHILLVLIGYASLLLSAGAALFYLVQERRLKQKSAGAFAGLFSSEKLPALNTLDRMITRSMSIGFVAVTLAVVAGSTWAFIESGTRWISEGKIAISFLTWGFYLLMIFLRVSAGWRGRKAALATLTVLGFGALTWAAHVGLRPLLER